MKQCTRKTKAIDGKKCGNKNAMLVKMFISEKGKKM